MKNLDPLDPKPGYSSLRQHRWSVGGAEYFVTFKLLRPASGLSEPSLITALEFERDRLTAERGWIVRTWIVMPDHLHVLFALGETTSLSACLRLFKGRLSPELRRRQLKWQDGYHEHRMRSGEDRLPVFLYIFLNPYRANLLPASERWPAYFCSGEDWLWFGPLTNSSVPFPEWLGTE